MRADIEHKLNETWYGDAPAPWWMNALVPLYRLVNRADRWRKTRQQPDDLRSTVIIIVGNITAGGSGKTPLVIRLCQLLHQAGLSAGVISRGYGRKDQKLRLVSPASDPAIVGDEPLVIAQRTQVPVIVSNDRCEAARKLLKKEVDVIISDDGLQHYRLPGTIEICVIDGSRGFGSGKLIPAGPLREPLDRLASFDHIIVNGAASDELANRITQNTGDETAITPMVVEAGMLRAMDSGQSWRLAQFGGCKANAVAGIGNPNRFFDLLRQARISACEHVFPDHHVYSLADFEKMDPLLPILMTEKDAVKCRSLGLKNAWYLSVDAQLPHAWEQALIKRVMQGAGDREDRE